METALFDLVISLQQIKPASVEQLRSTMAHLEKDEVRLIKSELARLLELLKEQSEGRV